MFPLIFMIPYACRDIFFSEEDGISLMQGRPEFRQYDGIILAVGHDEFTRRGILFDEKGVLLREWIDGRL